MSARLERVAVVGATGVLGAVLVEVLLERRFPLQELLPLVTERSVGDSIEWLDESVPVETGTPELRGMDRVFVCAPADAALEWIQRALHAEVPCIDLSGALAGREEVPLVAADLVEGAVAGGPLLACPGPAAHGLALLLAPLAAGAGLRRVVVTVCESAAAAGRAGIDALQAETVALFSQQEAPESPLDRPLAFDCLPPGDEIGADGRSAGEARLAAELARLLPVPLEIAAGVIRMPAFAGLGLQLAIETVEPLDPGACRELLAKAPGLSESAHTHGPSTRDAVGDDGVCFGRVRRDTSVACGLQLWATLDPLRLTAVNAVRLAEATRTGS